MSFKHHKQMSESFLTAAFLSVSGGLQDAYTYIFRGKVFANAQTGNIVLLSQSIIDKDFVRAIHYLVPLLFFALGIAIAECIHVKFQRIQHIHWRQLILVLEILLLLVVGFLPTRLNLLANAMVSFSCAMQVQSFRKVNGYAFASGTADYTVEFEPFATSLEMNGNGHVIASLGEDSGYVPYTCFSALDSYIQAHPDIIQAFTNAIQKGLDYVGSHTPAEIADVIQPQFEETDTDKLIAIIDRYAAQDTWKEDCIFTEESFTLLQNILDQAGELTERVDDGTLITTEFAEKAAQ